MRPRPAFEVGTGNSVTVPAVVIRPMLFPSVNHRFPSGPAAILPEGAGTANSVMVPNAAGPGDSASAGVVNRSIPSSMRRAETVDRSNRKPPMENPAHVEAGSQAANPQYALSGGGVEGAFQGSAARGGRVIEPVSTHEAMSLASAKDPGSPIPNRGPHAFPGSRTPLTCVFVVLHDPESNVVPLQMSPRSW